MHLIQRYDFDVVSGTRLIATPLDKQGRRIDGDLVVLASVAIGEDDSSLHKLAETLKGEYRNMWMKIGMTLSEDDIKWSIVLGFYPELTLSFQSTEEFVAEYEEGSFTIRDLEREQVEMINGLLSEKRFIDELSKFSTSIDHLEAKARNIPELRFEDQSNILRLSR